MANFTALKTAINNAIKTNGNEEITGAILQAILDAMVETLGDSAINDLENAITTEVTNRENAVGDMAANLAAEALARANKDNQLDGRINQEEYNRANADAALSRTVDQGFQTLNSQMTALNAAISALNAAYQNGYLYGGIATPSSSPSNNKCFYIALQGGTYTNFGGVGVVEGINILKNDSGWKVEHIYDQTTLLNEFYLLRQQVIRALASYDPIVIHGDVTNAPDEEDLTSNAQHLLKFKDRAYSPLNFSGLGMKILRKNILPLNDSVAFNGFLEGVTAEETLVGSPELIFWDRMNTRFIGAKDGIYYAAWTDDDNYVPVSTSLVYMYDGTPYKWDGSDFIVDETEVPNLVNCLTQDMINEANTIYIIRYDYTLKEDITIPANCVLEFDGGSLSNGVLYGNFEIISKTFCLINITFAGGFNKIVHSNWYVPQNYINNSANNRLDCSDYLQAFFSCGARNLYLDAGRYYVTKTLNVQGDASVNADVTHTTVNQDYPENWDYNDTIIYTDQEVSVLNVLQGYNRGSLFLLNFSVANINKAPSDNTLPIVVINPSALWGFEIGINVYGTITTDSIYNYCGIKINLTHATAMLYAAQGKFTGVLSRLATGVFVEVSNNCWFNNHIFANTVVNVNKYINIPNGGNAILIEADIQSNQNQARFGEHALCTIGGNVIYSGNIADFSGNGNYLAGRYIVESNSKILNLSNMDSCYFKAPTRTYNIDKFKEGGKNVLPYLVSSGQISIEDVSYKIDNTEYLTNSSVKELFANCLLNNTYYDFSYLRPATLNQKNNVVCNITFKVTKNTLYQMNAGGANTLLYMLPVDNIRDYSLAYELYDANDTLIVRRESPVNYAIPVLEFFYYDMTALSEFNVSYILLKYTYSYEKNGNGLLNIVPIGLLTNKKYNYFEGVVEANTIIKGTNGRVITNNLLNKEIVCNGNTIYWFTLAFSPDGRGKTVPTSMNVDLSLFTGDFASFKLIITNSIKKAAVVNAGDSTDKKVILKNIGTWNNIIFYDVYIKTPSTVVTSVRDIVGGNNDIQIPSSVYVKTTAPTYVAEASDIALVISS